MSVKTIPCGICSKIVIKNAIECSLCKFSVHMKCANLKKKDLIDLGGDATWLCHRCLTLLPFNNIENEELLYLCNEQYSSSSHQANSSWLFSKCQAFDSVNYEHIFSATSDIDNIERGKLHHSSK